MLEKKLSNNYALFNKYLDKISKETISKFNGLDNIIIFLLELCECGYIGLAAKKIELRSPFISPLLIYKIINSDRHLSKCVRLAKEYAAEMAEAVLYDRAINGYEEVTLNAQGECITRKKKYCSKSLLEYLKANSAKYQIVNKSNTAVDTKIDNSRQLSNSTTVFEVEAYELDNANDKAAGS